MKGKTYSSWGINRNAYVSGHTVNGRFYCVQLVYHPLTGVQISYDREIIAYAKRGK